MRYDGRAKNKTERLTAALSILFSILPAIFGCEYGIFNRDYPDRSELIVCIDNDLDSALSKSRTLTYSLDDEKFNGKFIKIEARHMKNDNASKGGFDFGSETISFTVTDDRTIVIPLNRINTLGVHEISIASKLDRSFDRKFIICVMSSVRALEISYSIEKKHDGINYMGSDEGSFTTDSIFSKPISLVSSSGYFFKLKNEAGHKIPTIDFVTKNGSGMHFEKESDSAARLLIDNETADTETSFTIGIRNSGIKINVPVIIKDIANIRMTEDSRKDDNTETIFIKDEQATKNYVITLSSASEPDRSFLAYFTRQGNSENLASGIPNTMKSALVVQSNDYFTLNFNGIARTVSITPKKETVDNGRNLHFYLYVFDSNENYFGRWRILIGGETERIEFEEKEIRTKTQCSSSTTARLDPQDDSKMLIWYLSKSKGEEDIPPVPLSKENQDNILSFLNEYNASGSVRIGDFTYETDKHSFGITQGLEHTMFWTTGGEAAALHMIAINPESGKYASMPFLISAESGIVLKSDDPISNRKASDRIYNGSAKDFESGFQTISFPHGQSYPDTYMKGAYGQMTRTFFLPHNRISRIRIKTTNIRNLTISPTAESNQVLSYELFRSEDDGEYVLEITPVWLDLNSKSKNGTLGVYPPCQSSRSGADSYGKIFYQYIGRAVLNLSAYSDAENSSETNVKIRIVLFENT